MCAKRDRLTNIINNNDKHRQHRYLHRQHSYLHRQHHDKCRNKINKIMQQSAIMSRSKVTHLVVMSD